jgi:hypothetical protein|tara:strand:- start:148 stop:549 length:402 start_codon:yes stop_codon:yes gene_type:complete
MKKFLLTALMVPFFAVAAEKVYLECETRQYNMEPGETTQYNMEPDKNECSTAGSDYSMGLSKSICFRWDPDTITITNSTEMSLFKIVETTSINRETLEMTKSRMSATDGGVTQSEPYSAGTCKIVEKNKKNKL